MARIVFNSKLQNLAYDLYTGNLQFDREKFSKEDKVEEANSSIRQAILDAMGGTNDFYSFQQNKWKVFSIINEVITMPIGQILQDQYNTFAEFRNVALGDKPSFLVTNNDLFKVYTVADNNNDVRRQRINAGRFTVATENLVVKIYEDLNLFLSGRSDFTQWVDRVIKSVNAEIGNKIYKAIYNSFDILGATFKQTGTYSDAVLRTLILKTEAKTGQRCSIYGTALALGKISKDATAVSIMSDTAKEDVYRMGYVGAFDSRSLIELPQCFTPGTETFAIDDNFLMVLPNGSDKIIKVVFEGDSRTVDTNADMRNDEQLEMLYKLKVGVGAIASTYYSIYRTT